MGALPFTQGQREIFLTSMKKVNFRILDNAAQDVTPSTDAKLAEMKKLIATTA